MRTPTRFTVKPHKFILPYVLCMTALIAAVVLIQTLANGFEPAALMGFTLFLLPFWIAGVWAFRCKIIFCGNKITVCKTLRPKYHFEVSEVTQVKWLYNDNQRMQLERITLKGPRGRLRIGPMMQNFSKLAVYLSEHVDESKCVSAYRSWIETAGRDETHFTVKPRSGKQVCRLAACILLLALGLAVLLACQLQVGIEALLPVSGLLMMALGLYMHFGLFHVTVADATFTVRRHTGVTYRFERDELTVVERCIHRPRKGSIVENLTLCTSEHAFSVHGYMEGYEELWNYLCAHVNREKITVCSTNWEEPGKKRIHHTPQKGHWL